MTNFLEILEWSQYQDQEAKRIKESGAWGDEFARQIFEIKNFPEWRIMKKGYKRPKKMKCT